MHIPGFSRTATQIQGLSRAGNFLLPIPGLSVATLFTKIGLTVISGCAPSNIFSSSNIEIEMKKLTIEPSMLYV